MIANDDEVHEGQTALRNVIRLTTPTKPEINTIPQPLVESHPAVGSNDPSSSIHSEPTNQTDTIPISSINNNHNPPHPVNPQTQSPLFQIPLELRINIYTQLFTLPPSAQITPLTQAHTHHSVLALLQTCRLIHHEAEPYFYTLNRLNLGVHAIPSFVSARRLNLITSLSVTIQLSDSVFAHIEGLQRAPNLASLHVANARKNVRFWDLGAYHRMIGLLGAGLRRMDALKEVTVFWGGREPEVIEVGRVVGRLEGLWGRVPMCRYN